MITKNSVFFCCLNILFYLHYYWLCFTILAKNFENIFCPLHVIVYLLPYYLLHRNVLSYSYHTSDVITTYLPLFLYKAVPMLTCLPLLPNKQCHCWLVYSYWYAIFYPPTLFVLQSWKMFTHLLLFSVLCQIFCLHYFCYFDNS